MSFHPLVAALVVGPLCALTSSGAAAQTAPTIPPVTAVGVAGGPPITLGTVGPSLREGVVTFSATATVNGQTQDFGVRSIALRRGPRDGWVVVDSQVNPAASAIDTLVLAPRTFATTRRALLAKSAMGDVRLALTFAGDSAKGEMQIGDEKRPLAVADAGSALASDALLILALGRLPLAAGWSARASLLNPVTGGVVPVVLRVSGEEQAVVPAGTLATWVVRADAGAAGVTTYYVEKGGAVARILVSLPQMPGTTVELVRTK